MVGGDRMGMDRDTDEEISTSAINRDTGDHGGGVEVSGWWGWLAPATPSNMMCKPFLGNECIRSPAARCSQLTAHPATFRTHFNGAQHPLKDRDTNDEISTSAINKDTGDHGGS